MILDNGIITGNPPYCHIPEVSIYGEAFNIHGKGSPKKATLEKLENNFVEERLQLEKAHHASDFKGAALGAKCMGLEPEQDECGISPTHIGIEKLYTYNIIYIYQLIYPLYSFIINQLGYDM